MSPNPSLRLSVKTIHKTTSTPLFKFQTAIRSQCSPQHISTHPIASNSLPVGWTTSDFLSVINSHYPHYQVSPPHSQCASVMSLSRSEFAELLNLLMADNQHHSVPGDLSPYLSWLTKSSASTPPTFITVPKMRPSLVTGNSLLQIQSSLLHSSR